MHKATRIIAPSRFLAEVAIEHLGADPDKISIVGWGMDHLPEPAASSGVLLERPYALFIGQTQPHWNVGVLIDAWRAGVPNELDLVISGAAGADDANLRRRVRDAGLEERVHFTGMLPGDRLMALIRDARLFVDPSLAESFGKPAIETMLLGIPCGVSNRGALPETTQGAALLFDATDVDAIVDVVNRLHSDAALRAQLAVDGPRVAGQYRWATAAAAYWDAVRAAMGDAVASRAAARRAAADGTSADEGRSQAQRR
jgi:glycosyltransferase involved in cell wall biosynthesis